MHRQSCWRKALVLRSVNPEPGTARESRRVRSVGTTRRTREERDEHGQGQAYCSRLSPSSRLVAIVGHRLRRRQPTASGGDGGGETVTVKLGIGAPLTHGAVALGQGMERGTKLAIKQANESQELKALGIKIGAVRRRRPGRPEDGRQRRHPVHVRPGPRRRHGSPELGCRSRVARKIYNKANIVQVSPASTNPAT